MSEKRALDADHVPSRWLDSLDSSAISSLEFVGKGAFALVYKATLHAPPSNLPGLPSAPQVKRGPIEVALKVLRPPSHGNPSLRSQFLTEVKIHKRCSSHPSIVQMYGTTSIPLASLVPMTPPSHLLPTGSPIATAAEELQSSSVLMSQDQKARLHQALTRLCAGKFCWAMVLEYCPGGNLADLLSQSSSAPTGTNQQPSTNLAPLDPKPARYTTAQAFKWLGQIASGLSYLHSLSPLVIHRDLKLENVLLSSKGLDSNVKICDLGLAVEIDLKRGVKIERMDILQPPLLSLRYVARGLLRLQAQVQKKSKLNPKDKERSIDPKKKHLQEEEDVDVESVKSKKAVAGAVAIERRRSIAGTELDKQQGAAALLAKNKESKPTSTSVNAPPGPSLSSLRRLSLNRSPSCPGMIKLSQCAKKQEPSFRRAASVDLPSAESQPSISKKVPSIHHLFLRHHSQSPCPSQLLKDLPDLHHSTFNLTGQVGSVMYLAPEVAKGAKYSERCDIFSFGMIFWELCSRRLLSDVFLERTNEDCAAAYLHRVAWEGWRPDPPSWLPSNLQLLMKLCLHSDARARPSFATLAARFSTPMAFDAAKAKDLIDRAQDKVLASSSSHNPLFSSSSAAASLDQRNQNQNQKIPPLPTSPSSLAKMQGIGRFQTSIEIARQTNDTPVAAFTAGMGTAGMGTAGMCHNNKNLIPTQPNSSPISFPTSFVVRAQNDRSQSQAKPLNKKDLPPCCLIS